MKPIKGNSITQKGRIAGRSEIKNITDSFRVQEFYLKWWDGRLDDNQQPVIKKGKFQVTNDRIDQLDKVPNGEAVEISFNIEGRTYDKKDGSGKGFFQNLTAWKITPFGEPVPEAQPVTASASPQQSGEVDDDDDLPF